MEKINRADFLNIDFSLKPYEMAKSIIEAAFETDTKDGGLILSNSKFVASIQISEGIRMIIRPGIDRKNAVVSKVVYDKVILYATPFDTGRDIRRSLSIKEGQLDITLLKKKYEELTFILDASLKRLKKQKEKFEEGKDLKETIVSQFQTIKNVGRIEINYFSNNESGVACEFSPRFMIAGTSVKAVEKSVKKLVKIIKMYERKIFEV